MNSQSQSGKRNLFRAPGGTYYTYVDSCASRSWGICQTEYRYYGGGGGGIGLWEPFLEILAYKKTNVFPFKMWVMTLLIDTQLPPTMVKATVEEVGSVHVEHSDSHIKEASLLLKSQNSHRIQQTDTCCLRFELWKLFNWQQGRGCNFHRQWGSRRTGQWLVMTDDKCIDFWIWQINDEKK